MHNRSIEVQRNFFKFMQSIAAYITTMCGVWKQFQNDLP